MSIHTNVHTNVHSVAPQTRYLSDIEVAILLPEGKIQQFNSTVIVVLSFKFYLSNEKVGARRISLLDEQNLQKTRIFVEEKRTSSICKNPLEALMALSAQQPKNNSEI